MMRVNSAIVPGAVLLLADVAGLYGLLGVGQFFRTGNWLPALTPELAGVIGAVVLALYLMNVYHLQQSSMVQLATRTVAAVAATGAILASVIYITRSYESNPVLWRGVMPVGLALFAIWAVAARVIALVLWRALSPGKEWLVVGSGARAAQLGQDYELVFPVPPLWFVRDGRPVPAGAVDGARTLPDLASVAGDSDRWGGVIIATEAELTDDQVARLMDLRLRGLRVFEAADFYERYLLRVPVEYLRNHWFAFTQGFDLLHHDVYLRIKRMMDILVSWCALVLSAPFMLGAALLVWLNDRGPVLYSQQRTGLNGAVFTLYKFRTMVPQAEADGERWASPNDARVTCVGRWLRMLRVDELPQLWNVLRGDMSFVGPRPERPVFTRRLEREIPYYDLRHLVKPGITGWAQVMYPYGASSDDARRKLEYDLYYIKNYSLGLDLYIILRTLRVVLSREGR